MATRGTARIARVVTGCQAVSAALYSYFRSSASWRVRIALAWKSLPVRTVPVHLLREGGEQHAQAYRTVNPQGVVPSLVTEVRC